MDASTQVPHAPQADVEYLTPAEVAAQMRCSRQFVWKHYQRFGGIKVAGVVRIPVDYRDHLRAADEAAAHGRAS